MDEKYLAYSLLFKGLSDPNRLRIVDMLSCGELCACVILEKLKITQPTLSHHMKALCDCGLANGRKDGRWTYYSLNKELAEKAMAFLVDITSAKDNCINEENRNAEDCCK